MKNQPLTSPRQTPSEVDFQAMPLSNRILDIVCCLLALPVLSLFTLVMTVYTSLVSPGPVFFRQERIGFRGNRFNIIKFRSMKVGADLNVHQNHLKYLIASNAPMVKLDVLRDTRLIPGGRMLRASGLDELPQLLNVLRGEMSLVGPRPCLPSEYEQFLPSQRERVNAVPGLTGLWQVSGKNRTTFDEMIRLDIDYVRQASLGMNLKIIFLTPWAVAVQFRDTHFNRNATAPVTSVQATIVPLVPDSAVRPMAA